MNRVDLLYLIPYLGSLTLSAWILTYTWRHRSVRGAGVFTLHIAGQALWILCFILELASPGLEQKTFWDKIQWMTSSIILITFPLLSIRFTDHKIQNARLFWGLLAVVPTIFLVIVLTDPLHHLIYPNPQPGSQQLLPELTYDFTWVVYVYAGYSYLIIFSAIAFLLFKFWQSQRLYYRQVITLVIGLLIPIAGTILVISGVQFTAQRDPTPLTSVVGNLIIAWGIFRYHTFQVNPVARDRIFEAMIDPVVLLDNRSMIIDINRSMLDLLGMEANQAIGRPAKVVFDRFPIPIKQYAQIMYARVETSFEIQGKTVYYEMTVWPLFDKKQKMVGRIYISHDITAFKELESELRNLNRDLEKRVQERTHELAEAYDTTLEGWAKTLELRDKETEGHSRRVTALTLKLAQHLGIPEEEMVNIRRGALLHDIGKMAIPDEILQKEAPLSDSERSIIQSHPETAYKLLEGIPFLQKAIEIPYAHHERWDGSGYPRGLKGKEIPLAARIFAVADVWDALLSDRPYNKEWPKDKAITYLIDQSGKLFDPRIVNAFLNLVEKGKI